VSKEQKYSSNEESIGEKLSIYNKMFTHVKKPITSYQIHSKNILLKKALIPAKKENISTMWSYFIDRSDTNYAKGKKSQECLGAFKKLFMEIRERRKARRKLNLGICEIQRIGSTEEEQKGKSVPDLNSKKSIQVLYTKTLG